uniref:Uncharacterized protein n=1 Tax=Anguilla anguilla TaxID=7936 RepID=A0A0E9T7A3_ANGAN
MCYLNIIRTQSL